MNRQEKNTEQLIRLLREINDRLHTITKQDKSSLLGGILNKPIVVQAKVETPKTTFGNVVNKGFDVKPLPKTPATTVKGTSDSVSKTQLLRIMHSLMTANMGQTTRPTTIPQPINKITPTALPPKQSPNIEEKALSVVAKRLGQLAMVLQRAVALSMKARAAEPLLSVKIAQQMPKALLGYKGPPSSSRGLTTTAPPVQVVNYRRPRQPRPVLLGNATVSQSGTYTFPGLPYKPAPSKPPRKAGFWGKVEHGLKSGVRAIRGTGVDTELSDTMQDAAQRMQWARQSASPNAGVSKGSKFRLNKAGGGIFGGAMQSGAGAMSFINANTTGDQISGMGKAAGGAVSMLPVPGAQLAGKSLELFAKVLGGTIDTLQQWGRSIRDANFRFAEFSSSMAQVQAEHEMRQVQLDRERGDRRAPWAKEGVEAADRFDRAIAPLSDALDKISTKIKTWILNGSASIVQAITGKGNASKDEKSGFKFLGDNAFREIADLMGGTMFNDQKDRPDWLK